MADPLLSFDAKELIEALAAIPACLPSLQASRGCSARRDWEGEGEGRHVWHVGGASRPAARHGWHVASTSTSRAFVDHILLLGPRMHTLAKNAHA